MGEGGRGEVRKWGKRIGWKREINDRWKGEVEDRLVEVWLRAGGIG